MIYILYAIVVISVILALSDGNPKNRTGFYIIIGFCLAFLTLSYFTSEFIHNRQVEIKMKRNNIKIVEIPDSLILIYGYRDKETGLIDWTKELEEGKDE